MRPCHFEKSGGFLGELRQQPGIAARALEFLVLTATRTGEAIGATWAEIDFSPGIWTIPGNRMKAGKDHRVPLSDCALEILAELPKARLSEFVFSGGKAARGLSNMALLAVLRRKNRGDLTLHGFRSTFRDWAGETTTHTREVVEAAWLTVLAIRLSRLMHAATFFRSDAS